MTFDEQDIFSNQIKSDFSFSAPLADRVRPADIDNIVGQQHLFGKNGAVRKMIENGYITNMILFGPPGTGKTTAANIVAKKSGKSLYKLNATSASISDIKDIVNDTKSLFGSGGVLLYLDEIQYFNKKQQQSLLEYMEDGRITLIASTTENPYMYVYSAIISRSVVLEFKPVLKEDIKCAVIRALSFLNNELSAAKSDAQEVTITDDAVEHIASAASGDVRRAMNLLETAFNMALGNQNIITQDIAEQFTPKILGNFDASGTVHYDLLSALQKSIRGSDPDAAIFYLARLLEGGDLISACRRLQVIASEDVGLAYPTAAFAVRAYVESAMNLGMPEASIPLSCAAILLATSPKSNSAYLAYAAAKADIDAGLESEIPPYMRPSNNFKDYKYPHDFPDHYVEQQYLPDDITAKEHSYYEYGDNKLEQAALAYWQKIKSNKNK